MSFKLLKPYSENQKFDFIIEHNHKGGLRIVETEIALYALLEDEIMENSVPVKNTKYGEQVKQKEREKIAKLSMTKLDFYKYILSPNGISYSDLEQILAEDNELKIVWELANRVYRGDEFLNQWAEKSGISSETLDNAFKEHGGVA